MPPRRAATPEEPTLRKDVVRHREALLDAAELVFAERGTDVPLDEVRVAAGLGRGTLYRHFANRSEIVTALAERNLERLNKLASVCHGQPDALLKLLRAMIDMTVDIAPLLTVAEIDSDRLLARFRAICADALVGARTAGIVRADLRSEDLLMLAVMAREALAFHPAALRRKKAPRLFALLTEGLLARPDR